MIIVSSSVRKVFSKLQGEMRAPCLYYIIVLFTFTYPIYTFTNGLI